MIIYEEESSDRDSPKAAFMMSENLASLDG
jgi:hypothetical protein